MNISVNHLDQSQIHVTDVLYVGNRVKQTRLAAGYSLEDLAVTCGLTSAEITRIEDGVEIDMQHLKRIAPALQISIESLIEGNA
jgi:transcriptional regulator with XRE-family HTH domain